MIILATIVSQHQHHFCVVLQIDDELHISIIIASDSRSRASLTKGNYFVLKLLKRLMFYHTSKYEDHPKSL